MSDITFTAKAAVQSVLDSADFVPPPAPPTTTGAVADLRAAMARFSAADEHGSRRAALESCLDAVSGFAFEESAKQRALTVLNGRSVDAIADLGFVVPTEVLASALLAPGELVDDHDLDSLRRDVLAVAKVIGRQQPATPDANDAVARLRHRFKGYPSGPVAPISLLYQNHDATAALLAANVLADHGGGPRRSSLARTVRVAVRPAVVDGTEVAPGTTVALDLESTNLEFGAGPHQCPGQRVAEQIVAGISAAIRAAGYTLAVDRVEFDPEGRPTSLPIEPRSDDSK